MVRLADRGDRVPGAEGDRLDSSTEPERVSTTSGVGNRPPYAMSDPLTHPPTGETH